MKAISEFFLSQGFDPFLAGLIAGIVLCVFARVAFGGGRSSPRPRLQIEPDVVQGVVRTQSTSIRVDNNGRSVELSPEQTAAVMAALDQGNKIDAIRQLRDAAGLGLKEAKDLAESLQRSRS
jgi:hypothetical protein